DRVALRVQGFTLATQDTEHLFLTFDVVGNAPVAHQQLVVFGYGRVADDLPVFAFPLRYAGLDRLFVGLQGAADRVVPMPTRADQEDPAAGGEAAAEHHLVPVPGVLAHDVGRCFGGVLDQVVGNEDAAAEAGQAASHADRLQ